MRQMTEHYLREAFAGESQAHMRYLIFADKAEREGLPNVARMFRAIAYAEQVHATNHYRALGGIQTTTDNLQAGVDGEIYEINEMYPVFNKIAKFQGEGEAERSTRWAWEAEKIHAVWYSEAKKAVQGGKDHAIGKIWICSVCGHTAEGDEAPEVCPICKARREKFVGF
ncbi:MAG: rubrerythrin family protein [Chloroflexi bacterium]|nr:rubrerythrin family protein [Chloroflexota bacterium]